MSNQNGGDADESTPMAASAGGLMLYFGSMAVATLALFASAADQEKSMAWTCMQSIIKPESASTHSSSLNTKSIKSLLTFFLSWSLVGLILGYSFLCEHLSSHTSKPTWDPDQYVAYLVLFITFGLVSGNRDNETKAIMNGLENDYRAIQELKGCAFVCFCLFQYFRHDDNSHHTNTTKILEHPFVALHVWETSFRCGASYDFSLHRIVQFLWRPVSLLVWFGMISFSSGRSATFALYYLCLLEVLAIFLCSVVNRLGSSLHAPLGWWGPRLELVLVSVVCFFVWDVPNPQLFVGLFGWFFNESGASQQHGLKNLGMWELYSTQYYWCILFGIGQSLNMPIFDLWREKLEHESPESSTSTRRVGVTVGLALANYGAWYWMSTSTTGSPLDSTLDLTTKYCAPLAIVTLFYLRTSTRWLRLWQFPVFQRIGACSLEAFILYHHIFLSANGDSIFALISPGWSKLNFIITLSILGICSFILFAANSMVLSTLVSDPEVWVRNLLATGTGMAACVLLVALFIKSGMFGDWMIVAVPVMSISAGLALHFAVLQHAREQSTPSTNRPETLKHWFPLNIATMCILGFVLRWSSANGTIDPRITTISDSCDHALQDISWFPVDTCNEATQSRVYRDFNISTLGTCSDSQRLLAWGWKKQKTPLKSKCQPYPLDAFTLLDDSFRHKNITFIGDSEIRHLYHATCRQVGQIDAGAYNTSGGKWSDYDRHYKPDTHLHFRWAPYADQLVARVNQLTEASKEQRPDALVIGGGAWDLLHRTRDSTNRTLLDSNIEQLAAGLATLEKSGQTIVWVVPTMINTFALMTEDKRTFMREDQMVLHRKKYVEFGVTSASTWVLDGLSYTQYRVNESYDGVHYPFSVYDAGSQILLNGLDLLMPRTNSRTTNVEFGQRANPQLGLVALVALVACLISMDSFFGLSYIFSLFVPSVSPASLCNQSLGMANGLRNMNGHEEGESLSSTKSKTSDNPEGEELDVAELDAFISAAEGMEVETRGQVSAINKTSVQSGGRYQHEVAFVVASLVFLFLPLVSGFTQDRGLARISTFPKSKRNSLLRESLENEGERRPCFYKSPSKKNWWLPRQELSELHIGQELQATITREYLEGKTGPKLFCEVGVGRCRNGAEWKIVNAMLRMGHRGTKRSVTTKRVARLRRKETGFPVYVTKIRPDNDALEVSLNLSDSKDAEKEPKRLSVSKLRVGQELEGTVVRVEPYGVLVDVGANRNGLLHIRKVSQLMGRYINQEAGLKEAGLGRGSRVLLQVESIKSKRLSLDFTAKVKEEAYQQTKQQSKTKPKRTKKDSHVESETMSTAAKSSSTSPPPADPLTSEEAAWAAYAAQQLQAEQVETVEEDEEEEDDDDYDYDDYDEDRDIEDSLGLGSW